MLRPLLTYLAARPPDKEWQGWRITRLAGGMNNLLYRATGPAGDLVVKFTRRDERDRAGREYAALLALREAGHEIAPLPLFLDRDTFPHPVVVESWVEGQVSAAPPATESEWRALLQHLALVHTVTPERTTVQLHEAVRSARTAAAARQLVLRQLAHVPAEAQPQSLGASIQRLQASAFPSWPPVSATLCHVDSNTLNFIRRPGLWAAVDWENSGWGDPAFELADLLTHPAYVEVPATQWEGLIALYCELSRELSRDSCAPLRTRVYTKILLVWWLARLARYLYEVPLGLDQRLVPFGTERRSDFQAKYAHYLRLAEAWYH